MQSSLRRLTLGAFLAVGLCVAPGYAQKYEVHPYAGGEWLASYNALSFKNPGLFGLKGGIALTDNIMIEGNGGYMNQFNFSGYSYRTHAFLYELAGQYNLFPLHIHGVVPFVSLGVGGLTINQMSRMNMTDHQHTVYVVPLAQPVFDRGPIPRTTGAFVMSTGQTFFNFSYGGGLKAQRLFGPMGLRADIRGRTMPNFFGTRLDAFEATGGLLFSWGER